MKISFGAEVLQAPELYSNSWGKEREKIHLSSEKKIVVKVGIIFLFKNTQKTVWLCWSYLLFPLAKGLSVLLGKEAMTQQ